MKIETRNLLMIIMIVAIIASPFLYHYVVNRPDVRLRGVNLPENISDQAARASVYIKNMGKETGAFRLQILGDFQFSGFENEATSVEENNPIWEYSLMPGENTKISFTIKTREAMGNIPENEVYEIELRFDGSAKYYPYIKIDNVFKRI